MRAVREAAVARGAAARIRGVVKRGCAEIGVRVVALLTWELARRGDALLRRAEVRDADRDVYERTRGALGARTALRCVTRPPPREPFAVESEAMKAATWHGPRRPLLPLSFGIYLRPGPRKSPSREGGGDSGW